MYPTVGKIKSDSDRAPWWLEIYGSLDVPLESPVPFRMADDKGNANEFYKIDVKRLSEEQIEKACQQMAQIFGSPIDEVREGVRGEYGLPIRASEIEGVTFDARLVL